MREEIEERYALEELLGQGGFGEVWRAEDSRVGRQVAVKIGYPQTPEDTRRFEREASLAGNLAHPNIATIHDFGRTERQGRDAVYLVMELLRGRSLADVLEAGLPPLADALEWAGRIADALGAAHAAGIVHRDVKPANVMVTDGGVTKVLDFGIAKAGAGSGGATTTTGLTATGMVIGSFPYMAPERWTGGANGVPVDGRADLYALGCVLMELVTGSHPFAGAREMHELLAQHLTTAPPAPSSLRAELPAALDSLVLDLLAKDPADRPADAAEVSRRLAEIARTGTTPTPAPTVAFPPPPAYAPTVHTAAADPVRAMLERRLTQLVEDEPVDVVERLRMLTDDLTEEFGAQDALTVRAAYHRVMRLPGRSRTTDLERLLPRMVRVLGLEHPDTITGRAAWVGEAAAFGSGDGRRSEQELREIVEQATRVLGRHHLVTLTARYHLASAMHRGAHARDGQWDARSRERALGERAWLGPLLPDLEWALTADSPVLLDVRRRLAHDAWLIGDVAGAALLYRRLFPDLAELADRGDPEVAHRVLRTIGEAGDPAAALAHMNLLLHRLPFLSGMQGLAQEVSDTRADFRRAVREQRRAEGAGGTGGLARLFGR
ncbi:serine/threonine protein kinase [Streptomyces sp. CG 926]|uniref:serine/threonine-protein kinase n=1 Tax=Streptomyces sp. CG 926 TaxID=1882405 RepID=UPI000D6D658C|nr:serine/threonine-protein kinase [Streptomyces sp. CG 926]PWK73477.1 serine/threonine protein kinase [Streptomyces sp. CG 926]